MSETLLLSVCAAKRTFILLFWQCMCFSLSLFANFSPILFSMETINSKKRHSIFSDLKYSTLLSNKVFLISFKQCDGSIIANISSCVAGFKKKGLKLPSQLQHHFLETFLSFRCLTELHQMSLKKFWHFFGALMINKFPKDMLVLRW